MPMLKPECLALVEQLILCRHFLADTEGYINQGLSQEANLSMEEAKQHFFKAYWPMHGKHYTGATSLISYPGDAMNPPAEPFTRD